MSDLTMTESSAPEFLIQAPAHLIDLLTEFGDHLDQFFASRNIFDNPLIKDPDEAIEAMSQLLQTYKTDPIPTENANCDKEPGIHREVAMIDGDDEPGHGANIVQRLTALGGDGNGDGPIDRDENGNGGARGGRAPVLARIVVDDPNVPIGITISLSRTCTHEVLEQIRAAATARLTNLTINVREYNRTVERVISPVSARLVTNEFFGPMLGGVLERLEMIVKSANDSEVSAHYHSELDDLPIELFRVYKTLSVLKLGQQRNRVSSIYRTINLVKLNEHWADVQFHLEEGTAAGLAMMEHFPPPRRGVTRVGRAKTALCEMLGMTRDAWDNQMQASVIPAALVRMFGRGSVLFMKGGPSGGRGGRGGFEYTSAATQYFREIHFADEEGYIRAASGLLWEKVVKSMWDEVPFKWNTTTVSNIPVDLDLESALALLR